MTTVCEFLNVNRFDSSAQTFVYKVYKDLDYTKTFFPHPSESIIWLEPVYRSASFPVRSVGSWVGRWEA